jgi:cell wall-associated NlpC family hydrolase
MQKMAKSIKKYQKARVIVPAAPVRKRPSHKQEMSNQLLYGEELTVLAIKTNGWVKVLSDFDNYIGWVTSSMIEINSNKKKAQLLVKDLINTFSIEGNTLLLSMGALVPVNKKNSIGVVKKNIANKKSIGISQLKSVTQLWLNVPYLWGGKTPMGVDCSGFVQVIYKILGVHLLRDAEEQATQGKAIKTLKDSIPGDLLFFNRGRKIVHVGIYLGNNRIIHSSGSVRIDLIDEIGIEQLDTGKRTHKLHSIKRVANFR